MNNNGNQNDDIQNQTANPQAEQETAKQPQQVKTKPGSNPSIGQLNLSISGFLGGIASFWRNLSKKTKRYLIISLAAILILIAVIVIILNSSPMMIIYSNLDPKEAGEIAAILQDSNIRYEYNQGLGTISVRENDADATVASLSRQNYPKTGFIYEQVAAGNALFETESTIRERWIENREKRLMAIIDTFTGVDYSVVTLSIPDNTKNILVSEQEVPSASVVIHMKPGYSELSYESIQGIQNTVLKSISSLSVEDISITDGDGIPLNTYTISSGVTLSTIKIRCEVEQEAKANLKVRRLLEPIFGSGNVKVDSNVTIDFDKVIRESTSYSGTNVNEDTGEQSGIKAGEGLDRSASSGSDPSIIGSVGTAGNTDDPLYMQTPVDEETGLYSEDYHYSADYDVNKVVEQLQREAPYIQNMSIGVVVNTSALEDEVAENLYYLIANSTGIRDIAFKNATDDDTIDYEYYKNYITILSAPFYVKEQPPVLPIKNFFGIIDLTPLQMLIVAGGAVLLLLLIIIIIVIRHRLKKRKMRKLAEKLAEESAAAGTVSIDEFGKAIAKHAINKNEDDNIIPIESKENNLKRQIKAFTEQNPEIAAQLIRTLMKEEGKNG